MRMASRLALNQLPFNADVDATLPSVLMIRWLRGQNHSADNVESHDKDPKEGNISWLSLKLQVGSISLEGSFVYPKESILSCPTSSRVHRGIVR
jgi:hypothetical protein